MKPYTQSIFVISIAVLLIGTIFIGRSHSQGVQTRTQFCDKLRITAEEQCGIDREEAWSDMGGDNYSRQQRMRDATACRRISEAVVKACLSGGDDAPETKDR